MAEGKLSLTCIVDYYTKPQAKRQEKTRYFNTEKAVLQGDLG